MDSEEYDLHCVNQNSKYASYLSSSPFFIASICVVMYILTCSFVCTCVCHIHIEPDSTRNIISSSLDCGWHRIESKIRE